MLEQPTEPKFVKNITALQKILAGVAVSMFVMVWLTGWEIIKNIFKPDFVTFLTYIRVGLAAIAIVITGFVGSNQISIMVKWLLDNYAIYRKVMELKKKDDENTD